ncbi:hypothetical protein BCR32DRAFT_284903 [Anaeromyces robustus]|uniref:G-protein coupled receptors family 3 profile domain-containing protein n=1 Tax=Anaeromyces robustus TaxID=1754192 RepID=A0A1Y1WQF3_9FUNG|nr:hypothetical protein BCR32DRAFT_284903 [Anaeromyces robustus]|eukprot:ORX75750.1 hypothetical protein BCR32DRAFT_284903 [Anaeromyces robustus]
MRILYFNISTYDHIGRPYPPPLGDRNWSWNDLVEDVKAIDNYFETNNIAGDPFKFFGLYDEEMKFFSAILRNYGVPTISSIGNTSTETCGYCSNERNLMSTIQALNEIVIPLMEIIKKPNHYGKWCSIVNKGEQYEEIYSWLNKTKKYNNEYYKYIDLSPIECDMEEQKNNPSVEGLIFCSPPSMSGRDIITTKEMLNTRKTDLGIAYVPGSFSFLGGSGLMISEGVGKERQEIAWKFILFLTQVNDYLNKINIESQIPPPYDYILDDDKNNIWNNDTWSVYVQQLRKSLPISYPRGNTKNFNMLERYHPVRLMFYDIFERGTPVNISVNQTCRAINYHLEKECTTDNFNISTSLCKRGRLIIDVKQKENCHGGNEEFLLSNNLSFDCPYENYDSPYGIIILVFILVGVTINVIYISLFTAYRKGDPIRKASYRFSVIIVLGCILMQLSLLLYLGNPKERLCYLKLWLFVIGFGFSLGGLVVKAYRIYSIFNNRDLKPLVITDNQLFKKFICIMICEIALLLFWTFRYVHKEEGKPGILKEVTKTGKPYYENKPYNDTEIIDTEIDYTYHYCKPFNEDIKGIILIYIFNGLLITLGCFYSIKTWSIPQMYSETKFVACSIYMISFVVSVCVPILSFIHESDMQLHFIIISLTVFFTCFLASAVYSIPKIYNSYWYYQQEYYRRDQRSNNSLDYSTNNGDMKIMRENSDSLMNEYNHRKSVRDRLYNNDPINGAYCTNETLNRAAAIGNTLIDHNMLGGNNTKYNSQFSMLNSSELNSSSIFHKRVSRCRIMNNEIHCPDCGCVFEVID